MTYWNTVVIILMIYMYTPCGLYYKHYFATIVGRKSCPPPLDSPDPSIPAAQSTEKIQVTLPTESKYRDHRIDDPAYPNIVSETNAQLDLTAQPVIQGSSKHPLGETSPYDSSPKVASTGAIPGGNISLKFDSDIESPHPAIYSYVFDTNEDEVPMFFNAIPKECVVNFDPHTPQEFISWNNMFSMFSRNRGSIPPASMGGRDEQDRFIGFYPASDPLQGVTDTMSQQQINNLMKAKDKVLNAKLLKGPKSKRWKSPGGPNATLKSVLYHKNPNGEYTYKMVPPHTPIVDPSIVFPIRAEGTVLETGTKETVVCDPRQELSRCVIPKCSSFGHNFKNSKGLFLHNSRFHYPAHISFVCCATVIMMGKEVQCGASISDASTMCTHLLKYHNLSMLDCADMICQVKDPRVVDNHHLIQRHLAINQDFCFINWPFLLPHHTDGTLSSQPKGYERLAVTMLHYLCGTTQEGKDLFKMLLAPEETYVPANLPHPFRDFTTTQFPDAMQHFAFADVTSNVTLNIEAYMKEIGQHGWR